LSDQKNNNLKDKEKINEINTLYNGLQNKLNKDAISLNNKYIDQQNLIDKTLKELEVSNRKYAEVEKNIRICNIEKENLISELNAKDIKIDETYSKLLELNNL
jgi:hypothetical protein